MSSGRGMYEEKLQEPGRPCRFLIVRVETYPSLVEKKVFRRSGVQRNPGAIRKVPPCGEFVKRRRHKREDDTGEYQVSLSDDKKEVG